MLSVVQEDVEVVKKCIPEIDKVEDVAIRDKIARIWAYTWRRSSWPELEKACYNPEYPDYYLLDHVRTTLHSCIAMADVVENFQSIQVNRQMLLILAILHDVSKLIEYEYVDGEGPRVSEIGRTIQHAFFTAHLAVQEELSWEIVHLILTHTPQSKMPPATIEGVLFSHIDNADADLVYFISGHLHKLTVLRHYKHIKN